MPLAYPQCGAATWRRGGGDGRQPARWRERAATSACLSSQIWARISAISVSGRRLVIIPNRPVAFRAAIDHLPRESDTGGQIIGLTGDHQGHAGVD